MLAQRPIRAGEVVLVEVPTLVLPASLPDAGEGMYEQLVGVLSVGVRKELRELVWGGGDGGDDAYETIMRIHPFGVSLPFSLGGVSSICRGVFLKTSRINHRCAANNSFFFFSFQK